MNVGVQDIGGVHGGQQIAWRGWGSEPFDDARTAAKPVLLSISASWCHWCHVMDRTTFSDRDVAALVNEAYVPVRVDTDMRPDVNARYNMGGWPTVAILDHDGHALAGATYVPPDRMLEWLNRVSRAYPALMNTRMDSDEATSQDREHDLDLGYSGQHDAVIIADRQPDLDPYHDVLGDVMASYDTVYGGFGDAPKFPMFDAINLAIFAYRVSGDGSYRQVFANTLHAMTSGGTYDKVEGGLFRYSTVRDWSVPHFEKMLLDNALLVHTLANAYQAVQNPELKAAAHSTVRYINSVLFQPNIPAWSGSQDADEEYYALPTAEERARRTPPRVDTRAYVDWNGRASAAMIAAGRVFNEPEWTSRGVQILRAIIHKCLDAERGLAHLYDDRPQLFGLAHDTISVGVACLAAFEATGDRSWLDLSSTLAQSLIASHTAARHIRGAMGLVSRIPDPDDPPAFREPARDYQENSYAAIWFHRLVRALSPGDDGAAGPRSQGVCTAPGVCSPPSPPNAPGEASEILSAARSCLAYCRAHYEDHGLMASAYALALGQLALSPGCNPCQ